MKNIFSGILAGVLILFCVLLFTATAGSLYLILKDPLPAIEFNYSGFAVYLQIFTFPLITSAAFLYVVTLLFTELRIKQVNDSFRVIKEEVFSAEKPRMFIKPLNLSFGTDATSGKLNIKYNGGKSSIINIVNAGKEPALEVRCRFYFDYQGAIKLIKANDLFHLFTIEEQNELVIIKSEKLGYSAAKKLSPLDNWQKNDFILPFFLNSIPSRIILPEIYLELFYWYNEITNGDRASEFPDLKCAVEYKRVNNTTIKQTFSLQLAEVNYSPGLRGEKLYDSTSYFITGIQLV